MPSLLAGQTPVAGDVPDVGDMLVRAHAVGIAGQFTESLSYRLQSTTRLP